MVFLILGHPVQLASACSPVEQHNTSCGISKQPHQSLQEIGFPTLGSPLLGLFVTCSTEGLAYHRACADKLERLQLPHFSLTNSLIMHVGKLRW